MAVRRFDNVVETRLVLDVHRLGMGVCEHRLAARLAQPCQRLAQEAPDSLVPELGVRLLVADALAGAKAIGRRGSRHVAILGRNRRSADADGHRDGRLRHRLVLRDRVVDVVGAVLVLRDLARDRLAVRDGRLLAARVKIAADAEMHLLALVFVERRPHQVLGYVLLDAFALLDGVVEKARVGVGLDARDAVADTGGRWRRVRHRSPLPVVRQRNLVGASILDDIRPVVNRIRDCGQRMVKANGANIADGLVRDFIPCACRRPLGRNILPVETESLHAVGRSQVFKKTSHHLLVHLRLFDVADKRLLVEDVLPLPAIQGLPLARLAPVNALGQLSFRQCHSHSLWKPKARRGSTAPRRCRVTTRRRCRCARSRSRSPCRQASRSRRARRRTRR